MRQAPPAAFPIFRSRLTAAVLAHLFVSGGESSVSELAEIAGTDSGTMAREVARLQQAGVLASRRIGRTRLVRANEDAPFYPALRDLVTITLGPARVLTEELGSVDGIDHATVFGSWAARMLGEQGPAPADIDVLVIGRPNRDDLDDAVSRARTRLGRDVNTVVVSHQRWETSDDAFLAELRTRPMVDLTLPPEGRETP